MLSAKLSVLRSSDIEASGPSGRRRRRGRRRKRRKKRRRMKRRGRKRRRKRRRRRRKRRRRKRKKKKRKGSRKIRRKRRIERKGRRRRNVNAQTYTKQCSLTSQKTVIFYTQLYENCKFLVMCNTDLLNDSIGNSDYST
jgi:hypothetical protein